MIEVKNVSMSFRLSQDRIQSIKEYGINYLPFQYPLAVLEFVISLIVRKGSGLLCRYNLKMEKRRLI